jgi:hypothetical protein
MEINYLWCSKCLRASLKSSWSVKGYKYGSCPRCGVTEHRNGVDWMMLVRTNDYPVEPVRDKIYVLHPTLF